MFCCIFLATTWKIVEKAAFVVVDGACTTTSTSVMDSEKLCVIIRWRPKQFSQLFMQRLIASDKWTRPRRFKRNMLKVANSWHRPLVAPHFSWCTSSTSAVRSPLNIALQNAWWSESCPEMLSCLRRHAWFWKAWCCGSTVNVHCRVDQLHFRKRWISLIYLSTTMFSLAWTVLLSVEKDAIDTEGINSWSGFIWCRF